MKQDSPSFENFGGEMYTFDKFLLLDETGPLVNHKDTKNLYSYMFENHRIPRAAKNFENGEIYKELLSILKLADHAPPSPARDTSFNPQLIVTSHSSSTLANRIRSCA